MMKSNQVRKLLAEVEPFGPSPELRRKVLDAVDAELATSATAVAATERRRSRIARWERRLGWASVTMLLVAIGLNFLVYRVGGTSWGSHPGSSSGGAYAQREYYHEILKQAAIIEKGQHYVEVQKNSPGPEVGRDRPDQSRGDTSYYQRRGGLDHRFTS